MKPPILVTRRLGKHFGGVAAISDLDLAVEEGAIHSIIGPNGAGKTTLFNCITQYLAPSAGEVLLRGQPLAGLRPDRVAAAGIGRTYQNIRLFRSLTSAENLLVGMHMQMRCGWWCAVLNTRAAKAAEERARDEASRLLRFVGLRGRADILGRDLAYGEQRRLEIARALAAKPAVLLLDEPTAGMNPRETSEMIDFIRTVRSELAITIVLIEHQMRVVMTVSDRVTVLDRGIRIAEGSPLEIQADPRVIEAYLGSGDGAQALARRRASQRSVGAAPR